MEKKELNMTYIYIISIFAIGVAMANIISFFGGVGFAFIGACVLAVLAARKILNSTDKKRFSDILVLIIIEFLMFVVLFFAYDFNINGITNKFPMVMRNICAIYSIFALGYVVFRYFSEIKGKKYKFVEYILGNYTPIKKDKKSKLSKEMIRKNRELENGTLEPKPISVQAESKLSSMNNIQSSGISHSGMARPVSTQSSPMQRPLNSQDVNSQPSTIQSSVSANAIDSQSSGAVNTASVQSNTSQPSGTQQQIEADLTNTEAKGNVMEIIKNHPNYWE